jgi:hypothetical protein
MKRSLLQGLVKEYTEHAEIRTLSSAGLLSYLNERLALIEEKYGVELITLAVQSLDPIDPAIADALRQQEQARLMEQMSSQSSGASFGGEPSIRPTKKSPRWNTRSS